MAKPPTKRDLWKQFMIHQAEKVLQVEQPSGEIDLLRDEFNNRDQRVPDVIYEPTMTSNPNDPRTAAMQYWRDAQVVRIEWGDGRTPYLFHEMTSADWRRLTSAKSPGRALNRWVNQHPYGPE